MPSRCLYQRPQLREGIVVWTAHLLSGLTSQLSRNGVELVGLTIPVEEAADANRP
jgi:hypothetical protein